MQLLERESPLCQLDDAWRLVREGGAGRCLLVFGEAGIGKTALLRAFLDTLDTRAETLVSGCEALFTPRPLGPLIDLADRLPPSLAQALHAGRTDNGLFPALMAFFRDAKSPRLLAIEDLHWADSATLDFVRYTARRLNEARLLLLLSYRSDQLGLDHPLRSVLGDLPTATTTRIGLTPLSAAAVATLGAPTLRDTQRLFAVTGGNPFYVNELLEQHDDGVPLSVSDAVQARLARLSGPARDLAEWVSACPGHADGELLYAAIGSVVDEADECVQSGLLVRSGDRLAFRHELARVAVHDAIPAPRRTALHEALWRALSELPQAQAALKLHHAECAGLRQDVARLAPLAAAEAAAAGAHREAARLYTLALQRPGDDGERAGLLEALADESMLINHHEQAILARRDALALHRAHGDALRVAVNLRALARLHWLTDGGKPTADACAREAIDVLEALPLHRERAIAYSTLSHLRLVGDDMSGALAWGERAIELAQALGDAEALTHALNNVASARLRLGPDDQAWSLLERSLALALEHGLQQDAARAYNNLFILSVLHGRDLIALEHAGRGIAYCESRGIDLVTVRIRIRRAYVHFIRGNGAAAQADLAEIRQHHRPAAAEAATRDFVAALLALRRGEADAPKQLQQAADSMTAQQVQIWFTSTAQALAEARWLQSNDLPPPADAPFRLPAHQAEIDGRWPDAAAAWQALGRPYDQARALCHLGDGGLREALAIFESLDATPAAAIARRHLRACGARGLPRTPRPRTRQDPLGLTARERQVFELLLDGMSNAQIAARLYRSSRTVEHHVEAVLAKNGVKTRSALIASHARHK